MHLLIIQIKKGFLRVASQKKYYGEVKILIPKFKEKYGTYTARKILKKLKNYNVQNVVLNSELVENTDVCDALEENKKYIITGNRLGKVLLPRMIKEISSYTKYSKEKLKVVLLMNEYSIENLDLIECISKDVKQLSVVSKNYTKFEKTANRLFENYGYTVKLYNNDSSDFKRDNIIINMDFVEDDVKKLFLSKHAIVISLNEKINNLKRSFDGLIINDIDIMGEGIPCNNFRKLSVCEAKLYRPLRKIKDNEKVFFSEKYIINGYIGKNGKITVEDFEKVGKSM